MRFKFFLPVVLVLAPFSALRAGDPPASAHDGKAFVLPESNSAGSPAASAFDAGKVAFVLTWIHEKVPGCPENVATSAAEKFLEDISVHAPAAFESAGTPDFPKRDYESALLRQVGAQLSSPTNSALRETVAQQRIAALLAVQTGAKDPAKEATEALARIKSTSSAYARRVLEGKMDDDDLLRLCKSTREPDAGSRPVASAPAKPKVLTASEIVSEFARHNESGAALPKLRAYLLEADLHTAAGEHQHLFLFRLRPDRFRLQVQRDGSSVYVTGFDGSRYWRQLAGKAPQQIPDTEMGAMRYLNEFIDPLFEGEGCTFERLEDGAAAGRKCYRVAVHRADGSGYTALIDQENFHEVARESGDGAQIKYSDFRDFAGLQMAYREEATPADGKTSVLELTRIEANPGLIEAFFAMPAPQEMDLFLLERAIAAAPATTSAAAQPGKAP
jgi:hypothetical protein